MNLHPSIKYILIPISLIWFTNVYAITPLTLQNNTDYVLTNGTMGYGPNTYARQLWIESFAKEIHAPDGLIMNVYVQPGPKAAGCVFFIYQVTDNQGNGHGNVSGSYCPDDAVALRSWSTTPDVKISTRTESDKVSFILNPINTPTPLAPLPISNPRPSTVAPPIYY
jgi:hypothetical protein